MYSIPSRKYPNEQYNIENFGVLMCPLSILIFLFFFFLGPFGVPLGRAHLIKNSPEFLEFKFVEHDVDLMYATPTVSTILPYLEILNYYVLLKQSYLILVASRMLILDP